MNVKETTRAAIQARGPLDGWQRINAAIAVNLAGHVDRTQPTADSSGAATERHSRLIRELRRTMADIG